MNKLLLIFLISLSAQAFSAPRIFKDSNGAEVFYPDPNSPARKAADRYVDNMLKDRINKYQEGADEYNLHQAYNDPRLISLFNQILSANKGMPASTASDIALAEILKLHGNTGLSNKIYFKLYRSGRLKPNRQINFMNQQQVKAQKKKNRLLEQHRQQEEKRQQELEFERARQQYLKIQQR